MENKPLISIVIPAYNVENYLQECLDSCLAQTYEKIQVVIVNDGSDDQSGEIAEKYTASDRRLKYIQQENQGVSFARNVGIDNSLGDYVMFIDGDDFIADDCVEKMVNELLRTDADMVFCEAYRWYDDKRKEEFLINPESLKIENGTDYLESNLTTYMWGKIYRRSLVVNTILQKCNLCEDMFFNLQVLPKCRKVSYIREFLYYYRFNDSSITGETNRKKVNATLLCHGLELETHLHDFGLTRKVKDLLRRRNFTYIVEALFLETYENKDINKLIDLMLNDYRYYSKTFKRFKTGVLLLILRYHPRFINRYKK